MSREATAGRDACSGSYVSAWSSAGVLKDGDLDPKLDNIGIRHGGFNGGLQPRHSLDLRGRRRFVELGTFELILKLDLVFAVVDNVGLEIKDERGVLGQVLLRQIALDGVEGQKAGGKLLASTTH